MILHSEIARQAGEFDIFDVVQNLNEKMIRRHPHVFGATKAGSSDEVLRNWSRIKAAEKEKNEAREETDRPLSFDIPTGLPSLLRAQKIGEKTARVDFDWDNAGQCMLKVDEELNELKEAIAAKEPLERIESELGDLLFSAVQLARHLKIDAEQALRNTNRRFEARFQKMRQAITDDGKTWSEVPRAEREKYWKK
ncbi:MAG: MazG family protein [Calothrix sp. SM1_5_4]|nr:MazG family protein [Calothrix sp. SM1_5_4]